MKIIKISDGSTISKELPLHIGDGPGCWELRLEWQKGTVRHMAQGSFLGRENVDDNSPRVEKSLLQLRKRNKASMAKA